MTVNFINVHVDPIYESSTEAQTAMLNAVIDTLTSKGFSRSGQTFTKNGVKISVSKSGNYVQLTTTTTKNMNTTYVNLGSKGSGTAYGWSDLNAVEIITEHGWYWSNDQKNLYGQGQLTLLSDGSLDSVTSQCYIVYSEGASMTLYRDISSNNSPSFSTQGARPYIEAGSLMVPSGYIMDSSQLGLKFKGGINTQMTIPSEYSVPNYVSQSQVLVCPDIKRPEYATVLWLPF